MLTLYEFCNKKEITQPLSTLFDYLYYKDINFKIMIRVELNYLSKKLEWGWDTVRNKE